MSRRSSSLALATAAVPLLAIASLAGVAWRGLYRDTPFAVAQTIGGDWVTLVVAVPALALAIRSARRGALAGQLVMLGVLGYAAYTYAIFAFSVRHNPLFLVYVAILSVSVFGLIFGGLAIDRRQLAAIPLARRPIAAFLATTALLVGTMWLAEILPALARDQPPASTVAFGAPTNAVHVLDLGFALPLMLWSSLLLVRGKPLGVLLATVLLVKIETLMLAVLAMAVAMHVRGEVVDVGMVALFGAVAVLAAVALVHTARRAYLHPATA